MVENSALTFKSLRYATEPVQNNVIPTLLHSKSFEFLLGQQEHQKKRLNTHTLGSTDNPLSLIVSLSDYEHYINCK